MVGSKSAPLRRQVWSDVPPRHLRVSSFSLPRLLLLFADPVPEN